MKKYHGGIDWDKWYASAMSAKTAEEARALKVLLQERLDQIAYTENAEAAKPEEKVVRRRNKRQEGERRVHPQVVVRGDWEGR